MNRLQALAAAAARRGVVSHRLKGKPRYYGAVFGLRGLGGLGAALDDNLKRRTELLYAIQAFQSELLHAIDGLGKSDIRDNATAYADTMARMLSTLGDKQYEINLRAGGDAGADVVKMMNSYDKLLASRKQMWEADLNDPSGAASKMLAEQQWQAAQAKTVSAAENVAFWEKVTNVDNPFSPVGILGTIKRYAIWGLVIGGIILAAPMLFPAIGKLIGHARHPEPRPAPPPPQPVAANRRRRR